MFKPILMVAALGAVAMASPVTAASKQTLDRASSQEKKAKAALPSESASYQSGYIPAAILLSGVLLITIVSRRRNLQKVLN